jgi:hypothetical protein
MLKPIFIVGFILIFLLVSNAQTRLGREDQMKLNAMIERHRVIRSRLPVADQELLGELTVHVRRLLFKNLPHANLLGYTENLLRTKISSITNDEAGSLAEYVLDGIASNDRIAAASKGTDEGDLLSATKQMQETQMSFNLQYLQLQTQMQTENRQYTAVSNIMKTKHDTVKNSIGNIR